MVKSSTKRKGLSYSEAGKIGGEKSKPITAKKKEERVKKYNKNPNKCKLCKSILPYDKRNNKFCGHSCAAAFNNKGVRRHGKSNKRLDNCLNCTKKLSGNQKKFCSKTCDAIYRNKQTDNKIILAGSIDGFKQATARKSILRQRGLKCEICGIATWNNQPVPVVLDHINGNPYDNKLSNLRIICLNCNGLTPTYAGRNYGNGRYSRRKRYKEGKSS